MADVLNGAFDAPFFVAASRPARAQGEVIMGAQLKHPGMKVDRLASPFQHDRAHIVIEDDAWNPPPVGEGTNVSEQQTLKALVKKELEVERPAVGERQHKAGEAAPGATDANL